MQATAVIAGGDGGKTPAPGRPGNPCAARAWELPPLEIVSSVVERTLPLLGVAAGRK